MITTAEKSKEVVIILNKNRMDKATKANRVRMPKNLTKEQRHDFIVNRAKAISEGWEL